MRFFSHLISSLYRSHRERDLPRVFDQLQQMETARMQVMKEHLAKYSVLFQDMVFPLPSCGQNLVEVVAASDPADDMDQFVESW